MSDNRRWDGFPAMQCGAQCGLPPLVHKTDNLIAHSNVRGGEADIGHN